MQRSTLLLIFPLLLAAADAHAERVYRLVDYPDLQNGHSLSGTITTTDDAPEDGLLISEEITNWSWTVTGAHIATQSSEVETLKVLQGIGITDDAILLPQWKEARLELRSSLEIGFGESFFLRWVSRPDTSNSSFTYSTSLTGFDGDLPRSFWVADLHSMPSRMHAIATAVPGPGSCALSLAILTSLVRRSKNRLVFMR